LSSGRDPPSGFERAFEAGNVTYALFSGGHDSLAAAALAAKRPDFQGVVHINTGIGIAETREFVRETCRERAWPLTELRAPDGLYEQMVLTRGGFPYGEQAHNSFLYYLKQKPLADWIRGLEGEVRLVTGIRKDESTRRMGAGISVPERRDGRKVWLSPILDWTSVEVSRFINDQWLRRNPVVDLLHRSGECLCGALAREKEIHEIVAWFPEAGARIQALERECEARGIAACVWAGRSARRIHADQGALFPKSDYAPLCSSCEAAWA
jgi:3'-phosphoadenosine 5'-phosphosulfate sulfotransferase (PAPS reductase)/FAD synthetase